MAISKIQAAGKNGSGTLSSTTTWVAVNGICILKIEGFDCPNRGQTYQLGTMPAGYRPKVLARGCVRGAVINGSPIAETVQVATDGVISIWPNQPGTIWGEVIFDVAT